MKQNLLPEQTAKLIELGFEKPKNTQYVQRVKARNLHSPFIEFCEPEFEGSYSIGELFEMLPEIHPSYHDPYCLDIGFDTIEWIVGYSYNSGYVEVVSSCELIDALYNMIIMLKEEGTI